MLIIAEIALLMCIPMVLVTFASMPPRRAAIASIIGSWLFLPNTGWQIAGLPDFTKVTATVVAVLIGLFLFDRPRLARFQPRWFDVPMFVWCFGNVLTSLSNDLGLYDGLSQLLRSLLLWGFPYFIGRVCLDDLEGCRECAIGAVIGGLAYAPLCIWEARMSPTLQRLVYGFSPLYEPARFGFGYRPIVFMITGLEVGMWMAASTLCAYWLWASKTVREMKGFRFGLVVIVLAGTTVMCKSVGAILLLLMGVVVLEGVRRLKSPIPVLLLAALPVTYITTRTSGLWAGKEVVQWTESVVNDRKDSVAVRIDSEDHLMERAYARRFLGWGGYNRSRIIVNGRDLYPTDGLWIITFGMQGLVGLVAMTSVFVLPVVLTTRRIPARYWSEPAGAPAVVLATLLGLYMLDNLSNAMANPLYAVIAGGIMGLNPAGLIDRRKAAAEWLAKADSLREAGEPVAAAAAYREAAGLYLAEPADFAADPHALDAFAYGAESLASLVLEIQPDAFTEARRYLAFALKAPESAAALRPDVPLYREKLADGHETMSQVLAAEGLAAEAEWSRSRALDLRQGLADEFPGQTDYRQRLADGRNDLAWFLVTHREARPDALRDAIALARSAVDLAPSGGVYWNTLGAAYFYAGDYGDAVDALSRAAGPDGATAFDLYLMAMAYARLGADDLARSSFASAGAWAREHRPGHADLARLHAEAASVLGV